MWPTTIKRDLYPLIRLAFPLVLTGMVGASIGFFQTVFLAHLSHEAMAAGALASVARLALAITGTDLPKTSTSHYNTSSKIQPREMMVYYRRARTPGGSYFFTLALQDRTSSLLIKHIHSLTTAFRQTRTHNPFITLAIVILPEHLHVLWQLPPHDCDYSKRWRQIKTYFTQAVIK